MSKITLCCLPSQVKSIINHILFAEKKFATPVNVSTNMAGYQKAIKLIKMVKLKNAFLSFPPLTPSMSLVSDISGTC